MAPWLQLVEPLGYSLSLQRPRASGNWQQLLVALGPPPAGLGQDGDIGGTGSTISPSTPPAPSSTPSAAATAPRAVVSGRSEHSTRRSRVAASRPSTRAPVDGASVHDYFERLGTAGSRGQAKPPASWKQTASTAAETMWAPLWPSPRPTTAPRPAGTKGAGGRVPRVPRQDEDAVAARADRDVYVITHGARCPPGASCGPAAPSVSPGSSAAGREPSHKASAQRVELAAAAVRGTGHRPLVVDAVAPEPAGSAMAGARPLVDGHRPDGGRRPDGYGGAAGHVTTHAEVGGGAIAGRRVPASGGQLRPAPGASRPPAVPPSPGRPAPGARQASGRPAPAPLRPSFRSLVERSPVPEAIETRHGRVSQQFQANVLREAEEAD